MIATLLFNKQLMTSSLRQFSYWLLLLLAIMLPFELDRPLLTVGPLAVTNLELLLGLILLLTGIVWLWERPSSPLPRSAWLLLGSGGLFLLTAVLAPEQTGNAVKASLRLLSGIGLAFALPLLLRGTGQRNRLLLAILTGGLLVAAIGLTEVWLGREFGWLIPFRSGITVTGEYLRLTGPLDYANQTAMFIEVTVLLLLGGWLQWRCLGKTAVSLMTLFALLLLLQASFQTLSRASFVTIGIVGGVMALTLGWQQVAARPWLGLLGLLGVMLLFNTAVSTVFRLRFASEGDNGWYQIRWQVPPTLTLEANEVQTVPITLTNEGALTWRADRAEPINLGGRWLQEEQDLQLAEPRWPFVEPVSPGQTVSLQIPLHAPSNPGEYTLIWDVVQEKITWFGSKSGIYATSTVQVLPSSNPSPFPEPEAAVPAWTYQLPIPERSTLWRLAAQLIGERPLLGIGLDNFRLVYGRLLDADSWNKTIHTNNWYLEFLVGGGLLASLPFFAWIIWESVAAWHLLRRPAIDPWLVAILAGLLAYLVHGLLDFFLLFNSTGLLFWLLVGLWWQSSNELNQNTPRQMKIGHGSYGFDGFFLFIRIIRSIRVPSYFQDRFDAYWI
jgi:Ig-like domain from next to BRCA1 gene